MPTQSVNYNNSANGWDVTIYWECDYDASSAYMWWEVNQNSYGRTFQLVERNNTGNRYNSGATVSTGIEYYLYVYKSGSYSQQAGPFTLYAPSRPTYTVSYDANGGSGAPSPQTKTYGYTLTLSYTEPTRTGYNFLGWSTSKTATSPTYYAGGSYTSNSGATLYAVWTLKTYKVSYNANGGSGAPSSQTKTYGTALTLNSTKPTKEGYNFLGWATSSSATTATYAAGGTYSENASVTLYAVWQLKTYSVTYNANGGSGAPSSQTKQYGVSLTLSGTKPTKTGYSFKEWNTSSSGNGTTYSPGGTYTANAALTLYAIWTADTYKVSFDANGGSGAPGIQTKTYGVDLTLSSTKPTRTGYTFKQWNTAKNGSGTAYSAGSTYSGNAAVTLYAIWTANQYTVKYNSNGGSGSMSDQSMTYDTTAALKTNIFTKTGYSFLGWATSSSGSVVHKDGASVSNLVSESGGSITLYAVWSINSITITFDAQSNGGTTPEASRVIDYGSSMTDLPVAEKPYYKFVGWFTAKSGGSQVTEATAFTASTTIYAQFVIDSSASVNVKGVWKKGIPYVNVNGVWKKGYAEVNVKGTWKQGIG